MSSAPERTQKVSKWGMLETGKRNLLRYGNIFRREDLPGCERIIAGTYRLEVEKRGDEKITPHVIVAKKRRRDDTSRQFRGACASNLNREVYE